MGVTVGVTVLVGVSVGVIVGVGVKVADGVGVGEINTHEFQYPLFVNHVEASFPVENVCALLKLKSLSIQPRRESSEFCHQATPLEELEIVIQPIIRDILLPFQPGPSE